MIFHGGRLLMRQSRS